MQNLHDDSLGDVSQARDINDAGQVIGYIRVAANESHPFLWDSSTGMQDLESLGGTWGHAWCINELGQVVGKSTLAKDGAHAFLWEAGTGMQDLSTLGGNESSPRDINESGQVVGGSKTADGEYHAFLWEAGTGMQDLGTLGGNESEAHDINETGQVVGWAETEDGERHVFLWEAGSGMQDLGIVTFDNYGYYPVKINDNGWIAGTGRSDLDLRYAFLAIPAHSPDLWIKQGATWLGDDIYNADATDQTTSGTVGSGQTRVYRARLYNDGDEEETCWLQGPGGDADWTVQYYWGTTVNPAREVTAKVTSTKGWKRAHVPPGGRRNFVIAVTPTAGVVGDYAVLVQATSDSDPDQIDCIQAITTVPDVQPDLHIKKGPVWGGDDIYNDDGTDQKTFRKVVAGTSSVCRAYVQNDGDTAETFKILGPAGDADWEVQYYWGKKVDVAREVTADVTSPPGWARPNVPPGSGRYFLTRLLCFSQLILGRLDDPGRILPSGGEKAVFPSLLPGSPTSLGTRSWRGSR